MEVWKRYDDRYEVSSYGNGRNEKRLLKLSIGLHGYLMCGINTKTKLVHQLVATCFLSHESCGHKIVVDHIDNDKLNNNVSNLQLINQRLNSSKDRNTECTGVYKVGNKFLSQVQIDGKNIYLGFFTTQQQANEYYQNALKSIENNSEIIVKKRKNSSKYKGITWNKNANKWKVQYKSKYLGLFNTELEAYNHITNYLE